jgi:hypothetical protein
MEDGGLQVLCDWKRTVAHIGQCKGLASYSLGRARGSGSGDALLNSTCPRSKTGGAAMKGRADMVPPMLRNGARVVVVAEVRHSGLTGS